MKVGEGLRRTGFANRGGPLAKVSAKRLAALGGFARSTFSPKSSPKPAVPAARRKTLAGQPAGHRIERDSAAIVRERSGGRCEIGIEGCWGEAVEKSHRIARGMGGRHGAAKKQSDRPSDLLDSCLYCHLLITRYGWRVDAEGNGWVLVDGQDPTAAPVLYRGDLVYLDDAGEIHTFAEAGA